MRPCCYATVIGINEQILLRSSIGKRTTVQDGIIFNEDMRLKITRKSLIWQLCKVAFNTEMLLTCAMEERREKVRQKLDRNTIGNYVIEQYLCFLI